MRDRFTVGYLVIVLAACVWSQSGAELDRRFDLFLALAPVLGAPIIAVACLMLCAALVHGATLRWRRFASVVVAATVPLWFFRVVPVKSVDWLRFQWERPGYAADLPDGPRPRIKAWLFRDEGAFGALVVETYVVYDEAGELALPAAEWSPAWKDRMDAASPDQTFGSLLHPEGLNAARCSEVEHLQGHWFFVRLAFC